MTTTSTNTVANNATSSDKFDFKQLPFQGFVFFNVDCTVYTARKKLTPADLKVKASDLPPATLASLGAMHSADPATLTKFESYRAAMRNACLVHGVRSLGGFAVPHAKAQETAEKLDTLKAEFYDLKGRFLTVFEAQREAWLMKPEFQGWVDKLRARLDSITHVSRQLQADWQAFTLGSTDDLPATADGSPSPLAATIHNAHAAVGDQALKEVASMAATLLKQSFYQKDRDDDDSDDGQQALRLEVTQKILSPIRKMLDKLDGLSFADPRLQSVVQYGRAVLCDLPVKGKLAGKDLHTVFSLVHAMSDPDAIIRAAQFAASTVEMTQDAADELQQIAAASSQQVLVLDDAPAEDDFAVDPSTAADQGASTPVQSSLAANDAVDAFAGDDIVYDDMI